MILLDIEIFKEIICSDYINHVILLSLYIQCTVRSDSLQKKKEKEKSIYLHMDTLGMNTTNKTQERNATQ